MEYTLTVSARARTMRLAVLPDARVVVVAPHFFALPAIERFVASHAQWIEKHVERSRGRIVIHIKRRGIAALKKRAHAYACARTEYFAAIYGLSFRTISTRAQKARWGSCSKSGNLSFNYKIAALPRRLSDYVIVHELCHLREMNHSRKFWELVALTIPQHKVLRKELRATAFVFD